MNSTNLLYTQLLNTLSDPSPLESILSMTADYMKNCVYLADFTGKLLGYALYASRKGNSPSSYAVFSLDGFDMTAKPYIENIWQSFCNRGYLDYDTCKTIFEPPYTPNPVNASQTPVIGCRINEKDFTLCILPYQRKDFARLVIHKAKTSLTDKDFQALQTISKVLTFIIEQSELPKYKTAKELLLYDFLQNRADTRQSVNERCRIIGIQSSADFQLMTLCNSQNITDMPIFNIAIQKLSAILPDAIFIIHNNRLIALYKNMTIDKSMAHQSGLDEFLGKYNLTAAVSLPFTHMYHVYQAYIQTLQALDEGLAIDYTDSLYLYQDYLPYHALSYVKNQKDFCHPCINQLLSEDALHQTEYTKTLYTFIMNFRNQKDAAQQMNIHYNTMKYRLKKIQSFIDFSLDDNEEFLLLYLSFKLMKLNGHIF